MIRRTTYLVSWTSAKRKSHKPGMSGEHAHDATQGLVRPTSQKVQHDQGWRVHYRQAGPKVTIRESAEYPDRGSASYQR